MLSLYSTSSFGGAKYLHAGVSFSENGIVSANLPDGFTSPLIKSATRFPYSLSSEVHVKNCSYILFKTKIHRRTTETNCCNMIFSDSFCNFSQQLFLILRDFKIFPVVSFSFVRFCKTDKI